MALYVKLYLRTYAYGQSTTPQQVDGASNLHRSKRLGYDLREIRQMSASQPLGLLSAGIKDPLQTSGWQILANRVISENGSV